MEWKQPKKKEWPQCVGMTCQAAKNLITAQQPAITSLPFVQQGSFVTKDYRLNRVRLFHDKNMKVTQVPRVG